MKAIDLAKKIGERPDILFTVSNNNMDELEKIWRNICLKNDLVLIINPIFDYNTIDNNGGLSLENINVLQKKWLHRKNVYLNNAFLVLRKNGGNQIENPICKAGSTTIVISPENKLILPCYHLGMEQIEINNNLYDIHHSEKVQNLILLEGKMPACASCVINCYMQPSFTVELNRYWFLALPSTLKYNLMKGTWKNLF
jgi:MoaA/NifB/PqqE/SkfB family radical SAM enzyme